MTPAELKSIRLKLGLSLLEMGRAIGYTGEAQSAKTTLYRYENGRQPIPPWIARLVYMYGRYGIPKAFRPSPEPATGGAADLIDTA
jgi:transcriptional regulator with XRE-family HTH domain